MEEDEKETNSEILIRTEILICTETIGGQLSFTACFMFVAAWIHFLSAFI